MWFGGVGPVWRDGEWLCYDAETDGIVISGGPGAVEVFFDIHQDDRDGGPDVICTDPADALRYVLFHAGEKLRQRYLYGRLLVPHSRSLARPGFMITPGKGLGATLTVGDSRGSASERRGLHLGGRGNGSDVLSERKFLGSSVLDSCPQRGAVVRGCASGQGDQR